MRGYLTIGEASAFIGRSEETLRRWDKDGVLPAVREPISKYRTYKKEDVQMFLGALPENDIIDEISNYIIPENNYSVIELLAGAGGLAIGLEKAGLNCVALNEIDKWACQTLHENRPNWKVLEGDIKAFDFSDFKNEADVVTGGFPCQVFSYAGKKLGLNDARGTLFFESVRL